MTSVVLGELTIWVRNCRTDQLSENPVAQKPRGSCVCIGLKRGHLQGADGAPQL
jgi:hypothetical protein